jgi:hypothetical protein
VNCGTRGVPDTVAPFRAWRGSRDLVAQSPKFHASAVALITRLRIQFSTAILCWLASQVAPVDYDLGFAAAAGDASGGCTSDGFTQFTLKGPAP